MRPPPARVGRATVSRQGSKGRGALTSVPSPDEQASPVFPDRLERSFHCGLPDFEVWREALGISPDAVVYREQGDGRTRVLKASADFAGAALELTGYGDACAPEPVGGAA